MSYCLKYPGVIFTPPPPPLYRIRHFICRTGWMLNLTYDEVENRTTTACHTKRHIHLWYRTLLKSWCNLCRVRLCRKPPTSQRWCSWNVCTERCWSAFDADVIDKTFSRGARKRSIPVQRWPSTFIANKLSRFSFNAAPRSVVSAADHHIIYP